MTIYDFQTDKGTVKLTLNMGALADLARTDHALYEEYRKLRKSLRENPDSVDEEEMAKILYCAYRAANANRQDVMSESEFYYSMTDSREEWANAINAIMGTKGKKTDFEPPSGKRHKKRRGA